MTETSWWNTPLSIENMVILLAVILLVLALSLAKGALSAIFNLVGAGLLIWSIVPYPVPVVVGVLTIVPWIALVLTAAGGGHIQWLQGSPEGEASPSLSDRPDAAILFMASSVGLVMAFTMSLRFEIKFIDIVPPVLAGLAAAVVMTALGIWVGNLHPGRPPTRSGWLHWTPFLQADPQSKVDRLFLSLMCAGLYGFGVASFGNVLLDQGPAQTYTVTVAEKTDPGRETYYSLELAPWPLAPDGSHQHVRKSDFTDVKPGDRICMEVHPGRFGWRWQRPKPCHDSPSRIPAFSEG